MTSVSAKRDDATLVSMSATPYRKPGEPAPIAKEHRRWFTKSNDVEKGPFEASAVRRSLRDGYIKPATLVRAEDEREWRELSSIPELTGRAVVRSPRIHRVEEALPVQPVPLGSFWGGFAATIFFGLLALVIVLVSTKAPDTRRGAIRGYLTRIGLTIAFVVITLATSR
jgi:hypothetical protein